MSNKNFYPPTCGELEVEFHKRLKCLVNKSDQGRVMGAFRDAFRAVGSVPVAYFTRDRKMLVFADSVFADSVHDMTPLFYAPQDEAAGAQTARDMLGQLWAAVGAVNQGQAIHRISAMLKREMAAQDNLAPISESRRPGSTAFAAAVGTAMRDVGFDGEGPDATAKVLYTSATLAYHGKRFVNPHQGGQRHDLLAETMRAFFCGYYAPSGTLYTEVL